MSSQCGIWDYTCTSGGSFRTTAALLKHWPVSWDVFHDSLSSMKHLPTTCHTCTPPELMGRTHSRQSEPHRALPMVADGSRQVVNKKWWGGCVWWVILGFSVACYLGMKVRLNPLRCFVWLGRCQQAATFCVIFSTADLLIITRCASGSLWPSFNRFVTTALKEVFVDGFIATQERYCELNRHVTGVHSRALALVITVLCSKHIIYLQITMF